ncbi:MAG TPA: cysteine desulfurase-like protein [Acidimicrobiia bacterium]|nr:cysteine desulfurase-like protein [Acidimicrobiia bacterium]
MTVPLDPETLRPLFPALGRTLNGQQVAYLDGPGGTQVPETVIEAMADYLRQGGSNLGGGFASSDASEATVAAARSAVSDLVGADPAAVAFGQNMTSLTFALSRALARTWSKGDRVVVTQLDHDANVTPWAVAAEERGVAVDRALIRLEDGTLDYEHLESLLDNRTRLVAVTAASNALGTVVDVARVAGAAHRVGALVYVDAVHHTPHHRVDIGALGADLLVASAYKFFGPHTGVLVGRLQALEELDAYRLRPAPDASPGKWETGTQSFESLAGVTAAVDYLASLGRMGGGSGDRSALLDTGMAAVRDHESGLSRRFLDGLQSMSGVRVHGPADVAPRCPTFALEIAGRHPGDVCASLAERGVFAWAGHYYALEPMQALGVLDRGGLVRIGFVHTTTEDEVDRVLEELEKISSG